MILVEGPFSLPELQDRRHNGLLFADDLVLHCGDSHWSQVAEIPELQEARVVCFRDPGVFSPVQFAVCRASLERAGLTPKDSRVFRMYGCHARRDAGQTGPSYRPL